MDPSPGPAQAWQLPIELQDWISGASPHGELVELALRAARSAGQLLVAGWETEFAVTTKSTSTDVVTAMDTAAESLIREILLRDRPDDAILGEEGGQIGSGHAVRWIVDPLDGTVNYLYGHKAWAVSLAAEVAGEVVVGVVVCPLLDEVYVAALGSGAFLFGRDRPLTRLRVGPGPDLASALVATGFGYAARRRAAQAATLSQVLPEVRDIRRVGAAAVDLCWLAAGRLDAYYERGLNPWDYAAGALIAQEAGAVIGGPPATPAHPSSELTWAACPALAGPFRDLILSAGADRDVDDIS